VIAALSAQTYQHAALESRDQCLSYRELWPRVARVAGFFQNQGAGPDRLVALRMSKSVDYVVALLACWWAGAAFVAIDPGLPAVRQQELLELCQPDLQIDHLESGPAISARAPGKLAYVCCTSGSSGRPKAVEIGWSGLLPMLTEQVKAFALGPGKRVLWLLSIQFDASLSDLGTALLSGSTLVLCEPGVELVDQLSRKAITHLDIPPALLMHYRPQDFPASLETLIAGGEPSDPTRLRDWAQHFRLINVYGPTEATICTSLCQVGPDWDAPRLGFPIAGMEHREVEGELWLSGPGLFLGYRGRPDLTQAACQMLDGKRYYKTGDRVQPLGNGDFRFLGRQDRQVKVRGHRLELEEVEAAARTLPGVERCLAELVEGELTLYYQGIALPHVLRAQLRECLPEWMLPSRLWAMEKLPETGSGKPDRAALPRFRCLDSLSSLEMAARLQAEGHKVTAVQLLQGDPLGMTTRQLESELPALRPPWTAPGWGQSILLTGATGQLGRRLLRALLDQGHRVYALVRDGLGNPQGLGDHPNLSVLPGDLETDWNPASLVDEVDVVFHCAARVNTVLPWACMRAVNLDCLPGLLDFCRQGRPKSLHFASTLSVFVSSDFQGLARPEDRLDASGVIYGGYAQTKWAADRYLQLQEGPIFVYRYGLLTADSSTGLSSPNDYLRKFARGLRGLGAYPEGDPVYLDVTPVDYAVEATLSLARHASNKTFHIANPNPISLQSLAERLGLKPTAARRFFDLPARDSDQAAAQLALCRLHPDPDYFERNRSLDLFQRTRVELVPSTCPVAFPTVDLGKTLGVSSCTA